MNPHDPTHRFSASHRLVKFELYTLTLNTQESICLNHPGTGGPPTTVGGVLSDLFRRPYEYLIRRWHWKASLFSSIIRCSIFFGVNISAGLDAASGAAVAEFVYRLAAAGFYGSLTQAFRAAKPEWLASLTAMLLLPFVQHSIEYGIHWMRGTPNLRASIGASVLFTVYSTLFNLYSMRRGSLVVGEEEQSVWQDIRRFPVLLAGFLASGPKAVWRLTQPERQT